ncbi:MAG TPA: hypothetical protein VJ922_01045 [Actinomycetota bacterium]|nr:hypothetical protein [Actinomycetota bacterium]
MDSEEKDWAAKHYRVERDSTGLRASKRKLRRIAQEAAKHGDPVPEESHDVVRIVDREGVVVMERDWGHNRQAAIEEEARIVEDLLHLDVARFRTRYGIGIEIGVEADDLPPEIWSDVPEASEPARSAGGLETEDEGKPEGASG